MGEDERYATHHACGENMEELDAMISEWTRERTVDEVLETMAEARVPAGKVFAAKDMVEDEHYAARENVIEVEDPRDRAFPDAERCPGPYRYSRRGTLDRPMPWTARR